MLAAVRCEDALQEAIQRNSQEELINRFVECFAIASPDERGLEFLNLLKQMTAADVPAILELLKREARQGRSSDLQWHAFRRRSGALDGPAAIAYHLSLPDSSYNGLDIWRVMLGFAQTNPQSAAAWLEANPEARHLDNAFLGYVEGYAMTDLRAATKMTLQSNPAGDLMMDCATEQLAEQAVRPGRLAGLEAWFDQLPADTTPGSARHAATNHVWWGMKNGSFEAGVAWVQKLASGPWRSEHIIAEVADRLSNVAPPEGLAWLESVQASPETGVYPGLDKVVGNWA